MKAHIDGNMWNLPPLEELAAEAERIGLRNGYSAEKMAARREKFARYYGWYIFTKKLRDAGYSPYTIAKHIPVDGRVIAGWATERKLPQIIAEVVYKKPLRQQVDIPEEPSRTFACVIGLCLGTTRTPGDYKQRLTYDRKEADHPDFAHVRRMLQAAFGNAYFHEHVKRNSQKYGVTHEIIFQSVDFFEHYNRETARGTRLPHRHLTTLEEKAGFLEGYFLAAMSVEYERKRKTNAPTQLIIVRKSRPENIFLMEQLAILLSDIGCYVYVSHDSRVAAMYITDPDDVRILYRHDCVPERLAREAREIAELKTGRRVKPQHVLLAAYFAVNDLRKMTWLPQRRVEEEKKSIMGEYGVSRDRVDRWYSGAKPEIAKRYEALQTLRLQHGREPLAEVGKLKEEQPNGSVELH